MSPTHEDEASASEAALLGRRVGGKYVVQQVLGRGGMGVVCAGLHEDLGQRVAIKFMLDSTSNRDSNVARFTREAQLAAQLKSEHVVRVYDVGRLEDGVPYMVMEYLEGTSLADELAQRGTLPLVVAVDYVMQALEAVAEAHALGVVHRDLKPDNLFLARKVGMSRTVKVLDFGISKKTGAEDSHGLTKTTALLGSPLYMSPEQIRASKTVDVRSDIWSIGVVLYQLIEGQPPFRAATVGELFGLIQHVDPPVIRKASVQLDAVLRKCLARDPAQRFQNVRDLADALQPFASATSEKSLQVIHQVLAKPSLELMASSPNHVAVAKRFSTAPPAASAPGSAPGSGPIDATIVDAPRTDFANADGGPIERSALAESRIEIPGIHQPRWAPIAVGGVLVTAVVVAVASFGLGAKRAQTEPPASASASPVAIATVAAPAASPLAHPVAVVAPPSPQPVALPILVPAPMTTATVMPTSESTASTTPIAKAPPKSPAPRPAARPAEKPPAPSSVTIDRGF